MSAPQNAPLAAASPESVDALRVRHQVRLLTPEQEGLPIGRLPAGVYGFATAPGMDAVPLFGKRAYHNFEVHKAADGIEYLIGFVTPEEAISLALGKEGTAIRMFPDPWQGAQQLVSVPLSQIVAPRRVLPREDGNPFPFTIA